MRRSELVDSDPARQSGWLARLWDALRLDGWRRAAIGLLPLAIPLVLAFAHVTGVFVWSDAQLYDAVTSREPGRPARVVLVRSDPAFSERGPAGNLELARALLRDGAARVAFRRDPGVDFTGLRHSQDRIVIASPVERIPGSTAYRYAAPSRSTGAVRGAQVLAAADHAIYRRQLLSVRGESGQIPTFSARAADYLVPGGPYYIRLSQRQNLPEFDASQIVDGIIDPTVMRGAIVVVTPPPQVREARIVTAMAPASRAMTLSKFEAAAIQTLVDGRGVRPLGTVGVVLLLAAFGVVSGLVFLRSDPKRVLFVLLAASLAIAAGLFWFGLSLANVLMPITALLLSPLLTALLVLWSAELAEDRSLRRFVTQTINLSSRKVLLKDHGRLPSFLAGAAPYLGITRSIVFEQRGLQNAVLEATGPVGQVKLTGRKLRTLIARAQRSGQPVDAAEIVPDWPGPARLSALGPAHGDGFWLYGFEGDHALGAAMHAATALASDYRAIQQLRADLSAGSDQRRQYRPADEWAGGAVKLISDHSDRLGTGFDGLETAVALFHPIGFPVMVNATLASVYEKLGLVPGDTTLPVLLGALTELDPKRVSAVVSDLLFHGGEFRVNCREIDTRSRLLRVGAPYDVTVDRKRLLIVELVDISEPVRLAHLRLRVSNLLDISIRNDLEAIGFAAALARSGSADPARLEKALLLIEAATARATARLEDLGPHLRTESDVERGQSFPIDAAEALAEACALVAGQATSLGVAINVTAPEISGFTNADPQQLVAMIEAILRIVLADTATGEAVACDLVEQQDRTVLTIAGGVGIAFERMYAALESADQLAPGPFRALSQGMAMALRWGAMVSYSTQVGKGYRFTIDMRRVG